MIVLNICFLLRLNLGSLQYLRAGVLLCLDEHHWGGQVNLAVTFWINTLHFSVHPTGAFQYLFLILLPSPESLGMDEGKLGDNRQP